MVLLVSLLDLFFKYAYCKPNWQTAYGFNYRLWIFPLAFFLQMSYYSTFGFLLISYHSLSSLSLSLSLVLYHQCTDSVYYDFNIHLFLHVCLT